VAGAGGRTTVSKLKNKKGAAAEAIENRELRGIAQNSRYRSTLCMRAYLKWGPKGVAE